MKVYHATISSDQAAEVVQPQIAWAIKDQGGQVSVSRSFGEGPAYLVLLLPDDASLPDLSHLDTPVQFQALVQPTLPAFEGSEKGQE